VHCWGALVHAHLDSCARVMWGHVLMVLGRTAVRTRTACDGLAGTWFMGKCTVGSEQHCMPQAHTSIWNPAVQSR
jgi:hypothetical protein